MDRCSASKVGRCLYRSAAGLAQCQSVPAAVVLSVARAWSRASTLCLVLVVLRFPCAGSRFQRLQDEPVAAERVFQRTGFAGLSPALSATEPTVGIVVHRVLMTGRRRKGIHP